MEWKLYCRYVLDLSTIIPAAFVCLAPVWTFLPKPRRVLGAAAVFCTGGILVASALCTHFRLGSNTLLLPLAVLAFLLYLLALRGVLSVWRAAFSFSTACFLLVVCSVLSVLLNIRAELATPDRVCQASTSLLCLGLAALVCLLFALTAVPWTRWLLQEYDAESIWRVVWLLPAGYTGIYLVSMPRFPQETGLLLLDRVQELSVLTCLLPLGVYLLFLCLFYRIGRESACNLKLTKENQVLAVESRRYEQLRSYLEKTRTLRHDFRQHLRVLSGLAEAGALEELRAYLKQCTGELSEEQLTLCASPAVDAIATYYDAAARRADIPVTWQLELPQKLPLPEADLCMMLGNLLENALRASHALPPEQRRVQVICRMLSPGMLGLVVENRFDGVLRRRGEKLLSTAHPGRGVGLISVQAAVDRYHGQLSIETEDRIFRVNVLLNV